MRRVGGTALLILLAASASPAFALRLEAFGNQPMAKQPDWAPGVVDVVNLQSRVYVVSGLGSDTCYYRGTLADLNDALRKFAAIQGEERQLVLAPGRGVKYTFQKKTIEFDWEFQVLGRRLRGTVRQAPLVLTVYVNARRPRPLADRNAAGQWLRDLDSDAFATREHAQRRLEQLGQDAKPLLRAALAARPAPEVRRRVERLLAKLTDYDVGDLQIPEGVTVMPGPRAVDVPKMSPEEQKRRQAIAEDIRELQRCRSAGEQRTRR